jgi:hypothetical protein
MTKEESNADKPHQLTIKLAGFALAHAAWSVSEGETLCTMAFTENGSDRQLFRFEADPIPESVEIGRQHLNDLQADLERWVLAFDGYITLNNKRRDALVIQLWSKCPGTPARIVQPYRPRARLRRFKILGNPIFVDSAGALLEGENYQQWFLDGVHEHSKMPELWEKWYQAG